jgi:hypothetical protein
MIEIKREIEDPELKKKNIFIPFSDRNKTRNRERKMHFILLIIQQWCELTMVCKVDKFFLFGGTV